MGNSGNKMIDLVDQILYKEKKMPKINLPRPKLIIPKNAVRLKDNSNNDDSAVKLKKIA